MKPRRGEYSTLHRLFLASLVCIFCRDTNIRGHFIISFAHASADGSGAPTLSTPPPLVSSSNNERLRNQTSAFFNKFDTFGPTLTITLRDPSTTTLLGGGSGDRSKSKLWPSSIRKEKPKKQTPVADDGTFGLSSKLAALFHISSSASTINGQGTFSSTAPSQFADGYMLDDGEIFLDPPSSVEGSSSPSSRGLFSVRDASSGIMGNSWGKSWG